MTCHVCRREITEEPIKSWVLVAKDGKAVRAAVDVCKDCWLMDHPNEQPSKLFEAADDNS